MNVTTINEVVIIAEGDMVVKAAGSGDTFEPETFEYVKKNFPKNGVFVDVGAYSGIYSLFAAIHKEAECCVAFEPNPVMYDRLIENIRLNKLGASVYALKYGLSDRNGQCIFYTNPNTPLTSAGSIEPDDEKTDCREISVMRYDDTIVKLMHVDMVKIDIEGHELNALKGMPHMIARERPVIIVECLHQINLNEVVDFLSNFDYELRNVCDERNFIFEPK